MFAWFISRRSHVEVVAAKDEVIAAKSAVIDSLEQQLEQFRGLMGEIPMRMAEATAAVADAMKPPAPEQPRRRQPQAEQKPHKEVDYATLDPDDEEMITRMAAAEMGNARLSPQLFLRKRKEIKRQILLAQQRRLAEATEAPDPNSVSAKAAALIDAAERGE